jgi:hypothetical protein
LAKRLKKLEVTKLASIEEELRVLKASLCRPYRKSQRESLKALKGIWKGLNFTYEQICAAELKLP